MYKKSIGLLLLFCFLVNSIVVNEVKIDKPICNILVLSGGGSYSALQLGILSKIYLPYYDVITAVSGGVMNAAILQYYNSELDNYSFTKGINYLKNLYSVIKTKNLYTANYYKIYKNWGIFDNSASKYLLNILLLNLKYPIDKKPVYIGLTNINELKLDIFKLDDYDIQNQIKIITASTSIPFFFGPVNINNTHYTDGILVADEVIMGLENFIKCNKYNITYISANLINKEINITNVKEYTNRLFDIIIRTTLNSVYNLISFDVNNVNNNEKKYKCNKNNSKTELYYYYPTYENLNNEYYQLDFDKSSELFTIGENNYDYKKVNVC